jgi:hypothetical protein
MDLVTGNVRKSSLSWNLIDYFDELHVDGILVELDAIKISRAF